MHKDLVKYDTDEKLHDSTAFENAALSIFNTFDHAMESMESNPDDCIKGLLRAGKMHSKIKNFDTAYFTVCNLFILVRSCVTLQFNVNIIHVFLKVYREYADTEPR